MGSTDRTIAIANKYGAKVYKHKWNENISVHKNQAIKHATKEFLLMLDADEEFCVGDKTEFKKLLRKLPSQYDVVAIHIEDIYHNKVAMSFRTARVFRRSLVRYRGRVHSQPITSGNAIAYDGCCLRHYGYESSKIKVSSNGVVCNV